MRRCRDKAVLAVVLVLVVSGLGEAVEYDDVVETGDVEDRHGDSRRASVAEDHFLEALAVAALHAHGPIAVGESYVNADSGDVRRRLVSSSGVHYELNGSASMPSVGQFRFSASHDGIPIAHADVIVTVSGIGASSNVMRHNASISPESSVTRHGSFAISKAEAADAAWRWKGVSGVPPGSRPVGRREWYSVDGDIHAAWKVGCDSMNLLMTGMV